MTEPVQRTIDEVHTRSEAVPNEVIVVHNYYYAKPGQAEAVYQWRLHASDVRVQLGFPRGRVLRRIEAADEGDQVCRPDVIWECSYPSVAAREHEARAVEATPEFRAVMQHMRTLLRRFDRQMWRVSPSET